MCIENTHFKCLKNYYRDLRVEVTHLCLECKHQTSHSKVTCYGVAEKISSRAAPTGSK